MHTHIRPGMIYTKWWWLSLNLGRMAHFSLFILNSIFLPKAHFYIHNHFKWGMNKQREKFQFLQKLSFQSLTSTVQIISAQLTEVQTTFYTPKESWLGLKCPKQHPKIQDNKTDFHFLLLAHSHPAYTPFLKRQITQRKYSHTPLW